MKRTSPTELAERLALSLKAGDQESFALLQVRLAKVLSRLWEVFAELLQMHQALTSREGGTEPVDPADFRPGDTLRVGSSFVRTDPRLVLAERMSIGAWADLIGDLAAAVLHAPDLARLDLLSVLADLDQPVLDGLSDQFGAENEDTDEFPVQPRREDV